jgi:membrane fusion protein
VQPQHVTPRRSLFRREAIEFQQHQRQWGEVVLLQPLSIKLLVWFLTAAVALIIIFLCVAEYARKETVAGYLTPTAGTAKIFAPRPGTITAIHVDEGQIVEESQPLLTIATMEVTVDGEEVNAAKLAALVRQKEFLTRLIAAEEHRTVSEQERLTALIHGLETEISHLEAQVSIQRERVKLSEQLVSSAAQLSAKRHMADTEYKRRQEVLLEQQQNLNSLGQQIAARQNQLTETRFSLEQLATVMAEKIQIRRNELSETEQRIAEADGRRAYVIRAPTAGRVTTLQATVGQAADPRRLQLEIVPAESVLQAELFVPTRAVGFVRAGQRVRILYDAFPYQKFGTYAGQITKVSKTILTASDASGPLTLKEPAYRVTAALERPDVDADGRKMPLQADMLLRADIILEKRSLIAWLSDPLLSVRM